METQKTKNPATKFRRHTERKTFAYETQVFLVCAENIGMDEAILRMTLFIFLNGIREMLMHFLPPVILLCAVTKATVLPVSFDCAQEPISSNTVAVGTG